MDNARAYLKTEGKLDYRDCLIAYYTYVRIESPAKCNINVNIHMHLPSRQLKKTLAIDEVFDSENTAIDYGVNQGKKYIDKKHDSSVTFLKLEEEDPVIKKYFAANNKPQQSNTSKKERR